MIPSLLALFLWSPPAPPPPAPAAQKVAHGQDLPPLPNPAGRLQEIEDEFNQALVERRPWRARELGVVEIPLDLARFGPTGATWWGTLLQRVEHELVGIRNTDLPPPERARFDALIARVRGEERLQKTFQPSRWDPVAYVSRLENMIVGAELGPDPSRETEAVLALVPELWVAAKRGLVSPKTEWIADALERLHRVERYLDDRLQPPAPGEPPRRKLDTTTATAAEATIEFARWLSSSERGGEPMGHAGANNWQFLIQALHGRDLAPARLKVEVLRDIVRLDAELGARELAPPARESLQTDRLVAQFEREIARARALADHLNLFADVPEGMPPVTCFVRAESAPTDAIARLRTRPDGHLLELAVRGRDWPPYAQRTRYALLDEAGVRALAVAYGPLGEAMVRTVARSAGPTKPMLWSPALLDGCGLYALDWACRLDVPENPFAGDAELHAASVRARLIVAARFLASLELHAEKLSESEVAFSFARRTGIDPETAELEVRKATHDPFLGIGYLGYMELRSIEASLGEDLAPVDAIRRTILKAARHLSSRPFDLEQRGV